jgi:hypothetical protein
VGNGSSGGNGGNLMDECAMINSCGNPTSPAVVNPVTLNSVGPATVTISADTPSIVPDLVIAIYEGTEANLGTAIYCGPAPYMLETAGNISYLFVTKSSQMPAVGEHVQLMISLPSTN